MSFEEIESYSKFSFLEIEENGKSDPRFMTYERLDKSDATFWEFRAFLYFTLHVREYYTGSGLTKSLNDNKPVKEFIMPNMNISDIGGIITDIDVKLP